MKKKNTLRRKSLKLKKSNRRNYLKRRNSLKLKKSKRRNSLKRRNTLKRRKMRGGYRTQDFWGESTANNVVETLRSVGIKFSQNSFIPKTVGNIASTGKTLKFSRFMYGNPEDKIKEAKKKRIEAIGTLKEAEEVLSDYQEEIDRGYYFETCVVREDDGDRAEGVLYLFIIDIPVMDIRYVISFGFGDLAWGHTRMTAAYPPDGKGGMWLSSSEWGTIKGEKTAEKRMNMLKESFINKFPTKDSVVVFASTISSDDDWKKRIGVYTIDISMEQSSVVSPPPTVQSSQQKQQAHRTLSSTQVHRSQQYSNAPYLSEIEKYKKADQVYIELSLKLLHSTDEQLEKNPITPIIRSMFEGCRLPDGNEWTLSFKLIRYIFRLILFDRGMYIPILNYMGMNSVDNSIYDIKGQVETVYRTVGISNEVIGFLLKNEYYGSKPPLRSIIHNFIVDYDYRSESRDNLLIKYMEETAKKNPPKVLIVNNYDQRTYSDFVSIMESLNQDSDDYPLKYSYVNIKNENDDLLYIFILIPGLFGSTETVDAPFYENVEFELICILESGEQKQFMFPINTRLLFWCSSSKEAGTGTSRGSFETAQTWLYAGGAPTPPSRQNASQTRPRDVEEPEKSFIEEIKEHFSGYKTNEEPITIPPLNTNSQVMYIYEGFNSVKWRYETLKYCKIDAINAQVNVKK